MDTLAKHIEQQLEKRAFCVVFEDDLERCWPKKELKRVERDGQIQAFAESRAWTVSIHDFDSGRTKALFQQ